MSGGTERERDGGLVLCCREHALVADASTGMCDEAVWEVTEAQCCCGAHLHLFLFFSFLSETEKGTLNRDD